MKHTTAWVIAILILVAGVTWYFNARKPVEGHPSDSAPAAGELLTAPALKPIEHPIEAVRPQPEVVEPEVTEPAEPLPELAESDPVMVESLAELLGVQAVTDWLITEQFIPRFVATVDSLPSRKVAPAVMPMRGPEGKFLAEADGDEFTISPANADRYQPFVALAGQLDMANVTAIYVRYYPWFQQAYEELGYPGAYFNDRLIEVIDHLLATPEPTVAPRLVKPEAVYLYADEDLEALSAGQKLLLRSGSENRAVLRAKLIELRALLVNETPG